jgi:methionine aminopeptidase
MSKHCLDGCAGGFPKSVCTSVNECVCHGIPDMRKLQDGDIINIDVTVYLNVSISRPCLHNMAVQCRHV